MNRSDLDYIVQNLQRPPPPPPPQAPNHDVAADRERLLAELDGRALERDKQMRAELVAQRNAMRVWANEGTFRELVEADEDVKSRLDATTLDEVFRLDAYVRNVDLIFGRVFGER